MNPSVPVVQSVGINALWSTICSAAIAALSLAPKSVVLVETNIDSLQRLSNAGNLVAQNIESEARFNHEINVIELEARKAAAKKAAQAALSNP